MPALFRTAGPAKTD